MLNLFKKYDATYDYDLSMYDNLPYKRNVDTCNGSYVAIESGNIIKFYRCKMDTSVKNLEDNTLKNSDGSTVSWDGTSRRQDLVEKLIQEAMQK